MDDNTVPVPPEVATAFREYEMANQARVRWETREREAKEKVLLGLGYSEDDLKPEPCVALTPSGAPLFKVSIRMWRGLDQKYLKEHFPAVYAECEKSKATKVIHGIKGLK